MSVLAQSIEGASRVRLDAAVDRSYFHSQAMPVPGEAPGPVSPSLAPEPCSAPGAAGAAGGAVGGSVAGTGDGK